MTCHKTLIFTKLHEEDIVKTLFATILLLSFSGTALAGSASDQAQEHFQSIASGDTVKLLNHYQDNSTLVWLGGPLDGTYSGKEDLSKVWGKFTKALGPMTITVANIAEHSNPMGSTVTADVFFNGKKSVPVHYVLSYRDNKLVNEIWQVSPALAIK
jgi:hypothetical protein